MQPKGDKPLGQNPASAGPKPQASSASATENPKERYLAMLSHDLRSSISNVISGLELMNATSMDADSQLLRKGALSAARQVTHLIDGILDIRAIDENDFFLELELVNLVDFLEEIYRTWLGPVTEKQLSFEILKSSGLPDVAELDRGRVLRVIGNLMDNAVKYTDTGRIDLSVRMDADNLLVFTVSDSGPGFSNAALDQLYEFRSRPDENVKPGTGLGLYIAKSLVENMGGTIASQNTSTGADVTVKFPLTNPQNNEATSPTTSGPVSVLPNAVLPDLSHLNILLAEDNATNRMVVTQMLAAMGASFDVACDGVEALEKFEEKTFNLALLDIEMPRMSGLDVIKHIRATNDARMNIPIVALTAYAMRDHREMIFDAGADGLIAKPILGIENFGFELLKHFDRVTDQSDQTQKPEPSAAPSHEVIDQATFNMLEQSVGADKIDALLENVYSDLTGVYDKIETGMKTRDMDLVAAGSHVLISVAGAIGATKVQNAGQLLNRAATLKDKFQIDRQALDSLTGIKAILSFIDERSSS